MKHSPMPLFNYRKRERHALVSDPQKTSKSKSDSGVTQPTASSSLNLPPPAAKTSGFDGHILGQCTDTRNHVSFSSSSSSANRQLSSKPSATYPSKPPSSLSKAPALITHKSGINNRRSSVSETSSYNIDNGQSGFNRNSNSTIKGPVSHNPRGRGRGGRNTTMTDGKFHSNVGAYSEDNSFNKNTHNPISTSRQGWNWNNDNSHNDLSTSFPSVGHDSVSSGHSGFSKHAWSNSSSSNMLSVPRNNNSNDTNTKPNINMIKLQSGSVKSQYGMSREISSQSKRFNQGHSSSFNGGDNAPGRQFGGEANISLSIFDDEALAMEPSSKYPKVFPAELDTSMRIFTCPIKDMQSWSEVGLYDGPILFEIYGLIISGHAETPMGIGKEFYVRDQSATIRCVFYEIDRELPHLMKGQVHRLVGSMVKKQGMTTGHFKVLSVRKADKEERLSCQHSTEVSLNEMDTLARNFEREQ